MKKEQQIEEMAKLACHVFDGNCHNCSFNFYPPCPPKASAERLYNAGYRKQSEWISVEERLPDERGIYLVANKYQMTTTAYFANTEFFVEEWKGRYTHWMPLPEPPKMKGGAG